MQNEGASKGILVTTSGYGKASFEFAQNKPLELLSGSNLLYLLEEHAGITAKIEPPEDWAQPEEKSAGEAQVEISPPSESTQVAGDPAATSGTSRSDRLAGATTRRRRDFCRHRRSTPTGDGRTPHPGGGRSASRPAAERFLPKAMPARRPRCNSGGVHRLDETGPVPHRSNAATGARLSASVTTWS